MKNMVLAFVAAVCTCAHAELEVYRLVRDSDSGNTAVVGADGVSRVCHILQDDEYAYVTNMVFKWYAYMNSSERGRKELHGEKSGSAEVCTNEVGWLVKRQRYEDGYVHDEKLVKFDSSKMSYSRRPPDIRRPPARAAKTRHPAGISKMQIDMREARERVKNKKPREITVNHDANTGKDTVVK